MTSIDLAATEAPPAGPLPSLAPNQLIDVKRENTRRFVAYILLAYLGAILIVGLVTLFTEGVPLQRAKDILGLLVGPVIGLVGTVVGFYFGAQTVRDVTGP
jgi:uncharacterized membrane protein YeaQ/YmgE (transglycosylase-associated protein family)